MSNPNLSAVKRSTSFRRQSIWLFVLVAGACLLYAEPSFAQATGTGDGATVLAKLKSFWFGAPGAILGTCCLALSIYLYFKEGFLAVIGVIAITIFLFFIPASVSWFQSLGSQMQ